jgi:hypothetical protein
MHDAKVLRKRGATLDALAHSLLHAACGALQAQDCTPVDFMAMGITVTTFAIVPTHCSGERTFAHACIKWSIA